MTNILDLYTFRNINHGSVMSHINSSHPLFIRNTIYISTSIALACLLAACGGGGGGDNKIPTPAPSTSEVTPATRAVTTTVIDGALHNVLVCIDKNRNGACDTGEPSATTNATGQATLQIAEADAGKYPMLAIVTKDSIDADTGSVPVGFTLHAPADQPGIISPLSTLVHAHSQATGSSTADATTAIQSQLGLNSPALANFTQDNSEAGKQTATLARLIVVTTQTQITKTAGASSRDGELLTPAQVNAAINSVLLQQLQTLSASVQDNPVLANTSTSIKDKQLAMETAAQQVASSSGLTSSNLGTVVAAQMQANAPDAESATAIMRLRWFSFTDPQNYYLRGLKATAPDNTPDATGKRYYTDFRERVINGQLQPWVRSLVYWTGNEWFECTADAKQEVTRLENGDDESLSCKSQRTSARQVVKDISNQKMRSIVSEIRSAPWQDASEGSFANWGPTPDKIPADAIFPKGSTLSYRALTEQGGSEYYDWTNIALIPSTEWPNSPDINTWRQASLSEFIAWNGGDFAPNISASDVHGNNAHVLVSRRDYQKADGSIGYKRYLVGLENGRMQRVRFYECEGNVSTLPRNSTLFINGVSTCKNIKESSYTIAAQGNAKVLRFVEEPSLLNVSNSQTYRLFIERAGITYVGYRDKPRISNQQRLNEVAANALFSSLGMK